MAVSSLEASCWSTSARHGEIERLANLLALDEEAPGLVFVAVLGVHRALRRSGELGDALHKPTSAREKTP